MGADQKFFLEEVMWEKPLFSSTKVFAKNVSNWSHMGNLFYFLRVEKTILANVSPTANKFTQFDILFHLRLSACLCFCPQCSVKLLFLYHRDHKWNFWLIQWLRTAVKDKDSFQFSVAVVEALSKSTSCVRDTSWNSQYSLRNNFMAVYLSAQYF